MNTEQIKSSYFLEDKLNNAIEAERLTYGRGDAELAQAYGLIADLLHEKLIREQE